MKKWKYSDTTPTFEFEEYYQNGSGTENVGPLFTYFKGKPSLSLDNILNNISGKYFRMDIIEPNKYKQGSLTMFRKL